MISVDEILSKVRQLPALPAALARIRELARDERSSAADFEAAIRPDVSLTGNVLRIANSAHFGARCRIESIRHAVARLGLRRISEIAAAAAFAPIIPPQLPGYAVDAAGFWSHSVAVAVLAERLAVELRLGHDDGIFTAALLHDVGKLTIAAFVSGASADILKRTRAGMPLAEAERDVLGMNHAEVGAAVADRWRLPSSVILSARWHHDPGRVPDASASIVVDLVHLADTLAHVLGFGVDAAELARAVDPDVQARIGIRSRVLERVAADSLEPIAELAATFAPVRGGTR